MGRSEALPRSPSGECGRPGRRPTTPETKPARQGSSPVKLLRVGAPGEERPAVRTDGVFLASGGVDRARSAVTAGNLPQFDEDGLRVGAPVTRPGKVICVGLNY